MHANTSVRVWKLLQLSAKTPLHFHFNFPALLSPSAISPGENNVCACAVCKLKKKKRRKKIK